MSDRMPNRRIRHLPELLAPAGGEQALRAAVNNGADAVYLGVDRFNARQGAENFTSDSLADAVRFAHLAGVRVYLTLNVLVLEAEMLEALDVADVAWSLGVDGLIVQDLGLLTAIRETMPHVRVHASTQMNAHNGLTIAQLGDLGVARVTLARELSVREIADMVAASPGVELESFGHGALCVCYSGQCLMSSLIGGRSANRGRCAQPCRLPYGLVDAAGRSVSTDGRYLLSPRDLASIRMLPRLVETGIAAIKVEGRMKSPEYVALVTSVYRAALDRLAEDPDAFVAREAELSILAEAFNRGFSEAYLVSERSNPMMSYRRPNNRGIPVGRVASVQDMSATILLDTALEAEDTIEFWTSRGRFAQRAGEMQLGGQRALSAPRGALVGISVDRTVHQGDRVFRVANAALLAAARRSFEASGSRVVDLDAAVRAVEGEPLRIEVRDERGRSGAAEGSRVEGARTKILTAADIREHAGRLGGTPYEVRSWDISMSPGVGASFSEIHRLRREALEDYEAGVLGAWTDRRRARPSLPALLRRRSTRLERSKDLGGGITLVAEVATRAAAEAALNAGADAVHLTTWAIRSWRSVPPGIVPIVPRILHDSEVDEALSAGARVGQAVAGNLGALGALARAGVATQAHWSLNAVNPWTVGVLHSLGAGAVWLSPELSERQIASIAESSAVALGIGVYGRQEMMVTEHCVLMSEGECDQECASCPRRRSPRWLEDRKGYRFPVTTDPTGRSHVYNAVPLDLVPHLAAVMSAGVTMLRLDLHTETSGEVASAVSRARGALSEVDAGETPERLTIRATAGHFFRGVV